MLWDFAKLSAVGCSIEKLNDACHGDREAVLTKKGILQCAAGFALLDLILLDAEPYNQRNEDQDGTTYEGRPCNTTSHSSCTNLTHPQVSSMQAR